jgi:hypothetical protein
MLPHFVTHAASHTTAHNRNINFAICMHILKLEYYWKLNTRPVCAKTHRKMQIPIEKYFSDGIPSENNTHK